MKGLVAEIRFLLKVARPGFWLTSVWFYLLPLGGHSVLGSPEFWLGLLYVTFPLGMIIYGWNDAVDFETDRLNPRKDTFLFGARPTTQQSTRLPWRIALVQAPFVVIFTWMIGARALVWFGALVLSTALYNWPGRGCKGRPGLDLLNQSAYLLVFVLSSWLNGLPQAPWFTFIFGAMFAMHSHLFGEIMDHEPDRAVGRRTTAVTIGTLPAKWLMIAFLGSEAVLVWQCTGDAGMAAFLAGGALFFAADVSWLWCERPYAPWQMRLFFLGWNAAALLSIPWMWHGARFAVRGS
ncbi:MAG TPA: UbiA family prenyltransferase [Chthoniobacter sp.]|nr:UbiA family prenyltransferase [Chthoniobacter sp.]